MKRIVPIFFILLLFSLPVFAQPEAVDLGLSVKWASCNVGASSPSETGDYFAWGETKPKDNYSWSTYRWCHGTANTLTMYCNDPKYAAELLDEYGGYSPYTDYITELVPKTDAAYINWGEQWRMPTVQEWSELRKHCTWQWTTVNGNSGFKVKSKINGNSIFLPATGYKTDTDLIERDKGGYWSSSLWPGRPTHAWYLYFDILPNSQDAEIRFRELFRRTGLPVRPVLTK